MTERIVCEKCNFTVTKQAAFACSVVLCTARSEFRKQERKVHFRPQPTEQKAAS